jgi:transcriptional regulator, marR family, putative
VVAEGIRFGYLFRSAESLATREYGKLLEPLGITPNQSEVLLVLGEHAPLSLKGLGESLICEEKSPSRLVQALIKKGLVKKEISSKDKRSSRLSLTAAGADLLPKIAEQEAIFGKHLAQQVPNLEAFSQILEEFLVDSFYEDKLKRRSLWRQEEK